MNTNRISRQLNYKWIVLFVSAMLSNFAWAEKADSGMPMNAQADAMRHDDQKLITTFTGGVVITKGSIIMRGEKIEVRQDAQGNQFATITGDGRKQAFFRQKREGINEFIEQIPGGYNAILSEQGVNLSGGQRQSPKVEEPVVIAY